MKASELRDQTIDELEEEVLEMSEQLFKLRFQQATGQLENGAKIRQVRKDLARVKTVISEKRR